MSALDEVRAKIAETAPQVLTMELERLDSLWRTVYPEAKRGNLGAVDRSLRIMERRARLLGLDAPSKTDVTSGGDKIELVVKYADDDKPAPSA